MRPSGVAPRKLTALDVSLPPRRTVDEPRRTYACDFSAHVGPDSPTAIGGGLWKKTASPSAETLLGLIETLVSGVCEILCAVTAPQALSGSP